MGLEAITGWIVDAQKSVVTACDYWIVGLAIRANVGHLQTAQIEQVAVTLCRPQLPSFE